jgi:hypothetical protein
MQDPAFDNLTGRRGADAATPRIDPGVCWWVILALLVAGFGAVRLRCIFNDLWLDEVWTLHLLWGARPPIRSPLEILTRLRHDNNHPLNTLFIYALGPGVPDWAYRLLACGSGVASVWLAGLIGRRQYRLLDPQAPAGQARVAGLLAATLVGGCYLLIHYASEARGYSPALGLSLLTLYALLRGADRPASPWAIVYGLAGVLAVLAHSMAASVLLAGLGCSIVEVVAPRGPWRGRFAALVGWHLPPCGACAGYYFLFIRGATIGGAPPHSLLTALGELSAYTLGIPVNVGNCIPILILAAAALAGLSAVRRRHRGLAMFYTLALLIPPLAAPWSGYRAAVYPRYLLLTGAWGLLLGGYLLARLWVLRPVGRLACLALVVLFLVGNAVPTARLVRYGRGQYSQALRYIATHTAGDEVVVSSDFDNANRLVIAYYSAAVVGKSWRYVPDRDWPSAGVDWYFRERFDRGPRPPATLHDRAGHDYHLEQVFPHAALSGWDWYLYRQDRVPSAATAP